MSMRHNDRITRVLVGTALNGTPSHVTQLKQALNYSSIQIYLLSDGATVPYA